MSGLTPSQTVGPFFSFGLNWPTGWRVAMDHNAGPRITLRGRVFDGDGDGDGVPVPDALIEIWQADGEGRYHAERERGLRGAGPLRMPTM